MGEKRVTIDEIAEEFEKKVKYETEGLICFIDLPNEIILKICHYMSPGEVLKSFSNLNKRLSFCLCEYQQKIDLTKCSITDLDYLLGLLRDNYLNPLELIVSNTKIPMEMTYFLQNIVSLTKFQANNLHNLSLIECEESNFRYIASNLKKFPSLECLSIIQSKPKYEQKTMDYSLAYYLYDLIFKKTLNSLTKLRLKTHNGLMIDKQLIPNVNLKELTISLENLNDLYVLFDGLMPNLVNLNVTLHQSPVNKQLSISRYWSPKPVSNLTQFKLITNEDVRFSFDDFRSIVILLNQLNKLTLCIKQWISKDQQLIDGNQFDLLFNQYLPKLRHFYCSIQANHNIDMQSFSKFNERWPLKSCVSSDYTFERIYTVPWPFKQLNLSMLSNDDRISVCPNVKFLTVDDNYQNLSYRFPNVETLTVLSKSQISNNDLIGFRQLKHLRIKNINLVPISLVKRLDRITLFSIDDLAADTIIYSNIKHLSVKTNQKNSLSNVNCLMKHFPYLRSLQIQLQEKNQSEYYDTLDILLDKKHLPYLSVLKSNCIEKSLYRSYVNTWIASKTSLKWSSHLFYAYLEDHIITVCI